MSQPSNTTASFGHHVCQQTSAIRSLVHAARMLFIGGNSDQVSDTASRACDLLECAEKIAQDVSGEALDWSLKKPEAGVC